MHQGAWLDENCGFFWARPIHFTYTLLGIITNTKITHATPGALYAHTQNRNWEADDTLTPNGCQDIAHELIHSHPGQKLDLIFGGGRQNFITKSDGGIRKDENLIDAWKEQKKLKGKSQWARHRLDFLNSNPRTL